jgi:hypothetical protein
MDYTQDSLTMDDLPEYVTGKLPSRGVAGKIVHPPAVAENDGKAVGHAR